LLERDLLIESDIGLKKVEAERRREAIGLCEEISALGPARARYWQGITLEELVIKGGSAALPMLE
jgi:hypothetical protein